MKLVPLKALFIHAACKIILPAVIAMLCAVTVNAQKPNLSQWVTNSQVNVLATDNNYLYVGGNFTSVGLNTGGGAKLSTASSVAETCFPNVDGTIFVVTPDGSGGWYIGGSFTNVAGVARNNIAHILSTGKLDATWNPNSGSTVYDIAVSGTDIYVAGAFSTIGGQSRVCIAKLNNTTGAADASWNPSANALVKTVAVSGSDVYAGGTFTTIGGQSRNRIAKLNNTTGAADASWNAGLTGVEVNVITISGSNVYVGGGYSVIGGQSRTNIARLNTTTGAADASWNPQADGSVNTIVIDGTSIYTGGDFATIGGLGRNYIAKLDNTTGAADASWNPDANSSVLTLAVSASNIYVGGDFTTIGGLTRNYAAKLDNTTGAADASWNPNPSNTVKDIAIDGTEIYMGGPFGFINRTAWNQLARFSLTTGALDNSWNPSPDNAIKAIAISGSDIYVGGDFTTIGGQSRSRIAKLNSTTGAADASWNASANNLVSSIAISGSDIYAGGSFSTIGGQSRNRIAKLNNSTGAADATWNANADNNINAITINGTDVYAGGDFTTIGGLSRTRLAKLNNTNGNADAGFSANSTGGVIYSIAISGSDMYIGGGFSNVGGQTRLRLAKLNNSTGAVDATWNPASNGIVNSVIINGTDIYAGGNFTTMGGQSRNRVVKLNNTTGTADASWVPDVYGSVISITLNGTNIYIGGSFDGSSGYGSKNVVKFATSNNATITWKGSSNTKTWMPCNWDYGIVPTSTENVIFPSGTTYAPDLDGTNFSVKDVTLNSGQTIQTGTATLTVSGNLTNNGTIDATTGVITLGGSSAQQISGSGSITNLRLNNSSGATITGGQVNVTGTLTISAGTLTTGGYLTLKSSATATARVAQLSGTISGNVTVERYIPAKTGRKWTYIACPVSGNTIRNGWQDDVFITGAGTGGTICGTAGTQYNSNGFDATFASAPSMYVYNVTPVSGSRWVSVGNPTLTNLTPGIGYRMNIRGPRGASDANCSSQLTTGVPGAPATATLSATGTLMQGNTNVAVYGKTNYNSISGSGNAYTLIGNPYASEVSLQSFYTTNSANITSSFWFYTPLNAYTTYCTYNATTQQALDFPSGYTNGTVSDVVLASGQAFFVERTGNADVNAVFQESHKTTSATNGNNFYKTPPVITDKIKVELRSVTDEEMKTSVFINYINDPETSVTDVTPFDSYSFNTGNPFYLVSQKAGKALAIQTRPAFNGNDTVNLSIKGDAGTYNLNFSEYNDFTSATEIKLLDAFLGTETNIRVQKDYAFTITTNTASQGAARFKIVFRSSIILPVSGIALKAEQKTEGVQLNWLVLAEKEMINYSIERSADGKNFSAIGNLPAVNNTGTNATYTWLDAKPLNGLNYYRIKAQGKNGEVFYSTIVKLQQGKIVTLHVYPNPVTDRLNIVVSNAGNGSYSYKVINAYGQLLLQQHNITMAAGVININTASLASGLYTVQLVNEKGDVITERFVKQ